LSGCGNLSFYWFIYQQQQQKKKHQIKHTWLESDPENVVAVHCKAGKGRTGTLIACYLLWCKKCKTASEALQFFGYYRTKDQKVFFFKKQLQINKNIQLKGSHNSKSKTLCKLFWSTSSGI